MSTIYNPYNKKCRYIHCRIEFIAERLNQEYCTPAHHVLYNNLIARERRNIVKSINSILLRNFLILDKLYEGGNRIVKLDEIIRQGLNPSHYTHKVLNDAKTKWIPFYYGIGLIEEENKQFNIIKP